MAAAIHNAAAKAKAAASETEKGVPLAPSAKDMKPWYSDEKSREPGSSDLPEDKKYVSYLYPLAPQEI